MLTNFTNKNDSGSILVGLRLGLGMGRKDSRYFTQWFACYSPWISTQNEEAQHTFDNKKTHQQKGEDMYQIFTLTSELRTQTISLQCKRNTLMVKFSSLLAWLAARPSCWLAGLARSCGNFSTQQLLKVSMGIFTFLKSNPSQTIAHF